MRNLTEQETICQHRRIESLSEAIECLKQASRFLCQPLGSDESDILCDLIESLAQERAELKCWLQGDG